jgi:prepilin-type processing-associated H-X9-DG protein
VRKFGTSGRIYYQKELHYGMNKWNIGGAAWSSTMPPVQKLNRLKQTACKIVIMDTIDSNAGYSGVHWFDGSVITTSTTFGYLDWRHQLHANAGYADGHVAAKSYGDLSFGYPACLSTPELGWGN